MSLAQPLPPLLNCNSHEACLRLRNTIVRSFDDFSYEFVDFCPLLKVRLSEIGKKFCYTSEWQLWAVRDQKGEHGSQLCFGSSLRNPNIRVLRCERPFSALCCTDPGSTLISARRTCSRISISCGGSRTSTALPQDTRCQAISTQPLAVNPTSRLPFGISVTTWSGWNTNSRATVAARGAGARGDVLRQKRTIQRRTWQSTQGRSQDRDGRCQPCHSF